MLRRLLAFALAAASMAAVGLAPGTGHALGESSRKISGTACEIHSLSLTYDEVRGQWTGSSSMRCRSGALEAPQPLLQLTFSLYPVQGVVLQAPYVTGNPVMTSRQDPTNPNTTMISCGLCADIQAQGTRAALVPGFYVMKATGYVSQESGGLRNGYHTACFYVQGDFDGGAIAQPGCLP